MENKTKKKTIDEMVEELYEKNKLEILEDLARNLPLNEPYAPEGVVTTVRSMCPDLTEEELDYVMSKYTGNIEKG